MLLINTQDDTMHTDAGWQRDLIDALRLESAFNASGLAFPNVDWAAALEPTPADCAHAVALLSAGVLRDSHDQRWLAVVDLAG
jgi:hypothetical protein